MKKYKVLEKNLISPFKRFKFEIGKEYICDDFDKDKNKSCSRGFYATELEGIIYSFRFNLEHRIFECEVFGGKVEINNYKCRYEKFKLIKEIPHRELKKRAKEKDKTLGYKLSEILFPVNPFKIKNKSYSENTLKKYIKQWDSVEDSVWDSVRDSVQDSVWASVRDSVQDSVWASVRASVWDSVEDSVRDSMGASVQASMWAYISSFFPDISKWKYIDHDKLKNPFEPAFKLWRAGYVISSDGKTYRVHTGQNAKIIYEIKKEDL